MGSRYPLAFIACVVCNKPLKGGNHKCDPKTINRREAALNAHGNGHDKNYVSFNQRLNDGIKIINGEY